MTAFPVADTRHDIWLVPVVWPEPCAGPGSGRTNACLAADPWLPAADISEDKFVRSRNEVAAG